MLIFLIGLPGSGKTTLGKQLAKQIQYAFSDLDECIVKKHSLTIEEIFSTAGEDAFRLMESACLKEYSKFQNTIISTGGGVPCFFDNMSWMNQNGISIFLNPPLSELAKRLSVSDNNHRPMLKGKDIHNLNLFLEDKYDERSSYYNQSKIVIDKINPSIFDIIEKLKPYL